MKAVAEYFGPMPEYFAQRMARMPPVLILHGDRDPLVPVKAAYDLEALLKQKGDDTKLFNFNVGTQF